MPIYGDTAGGVYISRNALGHISEAANRPIISDVATHIGYGSTGGVMATPEPVGLLTAQLALRILNGDKIADIPIAESSSAKPIFDWRQLQRFGISDRKLPPESDIRFRPQGMWEQYQGRLIAIFSVVVLQAAMIALLLLERRRRLRAELDARGRLLETIHLNRTAVAGALSAAFSHELNQPLAAILSNAEAAEILLKDKRPNLVQLTQIMEDIRRDDQRAGQIIKNVGSLLKRKNEIELQQFDLNDVVHGALKLLDSQASRRGVELSISQTQEALPVSADVLHLQQVILNLAINAMDAMVECGPGSRIMILKTALVGECEAEVSIADTGPGIASDKLEDVFNTFFTTKPHGTGLGLSIARTIVQTYGGTLWAENKPDGGAVFRFTLPLVRG